MLAEMLAPASPAPYLVSVGNHEVDNNRNSRLAWNTARFCTGLDPAFSAERMYFRKDRPARSFSSWTATTWSTGDDGRGIEGANAPAGKPG